MLSVFRKNEEINLLNIWAWNEYQLAKYRKTKQMKSFSSFIFNLIPFCV